MTNAVTMPTTSTTISVWVMARPVHHELDRLDEAPAEHDGNGQEERELGRRRARAAAQHAADDGGARTARAGDRWRAPGSSPILSAVFQSMSSTSGHLEQAPLRPRLPQSPRHDARMAAAHHMAAARHVDGGHRPGASRLAVAALQHDEDDAVQDEHRRPRPPCCRSARSPSRQARSRGWRPGMHPIDDHPPQAPRALLLGRASCGARRG